MKMSRLRPNKCICVCLLLQVFIFGGLHSKLTDISVYPDLWLADFARKISGSQLSMKEDQEVALSHLHSIQSFDRRLTFFHIPKTAGTAIEHAAGEQQIPWGSCLFNHKPKRDICRHIYPGAEWPGHTGWWHIPTHLFPVGIVDPYSASELFAVVRDPYDRMVSEFYYICSLKVKDWRPDQCERTRLFDKAYMNAWLHQKLGAEHSDDRPQTFIRDNGHFTPQYDYIVGPHQVRMVDYVLRLETLNEDFGKLMHAFALDTVQLVKMNAISAEARNDTTHLKVMDLDDKTLQKLHERYPHDGRFKSFN